MILIDGNLSLTGPLRLHPNEQNLIEGTLASDIYVFEGTSNVTISEPDYAFHSHFDQILIESINI